MNRMRKWRNSADGVRSIFDADETFQRMIRMVRRSADRAPTAGERFAAVEGLRADEAVARWQLFADSLKTSDDFSWCTHPAAQRCYVAPLDRTRWQHTGTDPVRGRLHRTVIRGGGFYRAVCPDCGQWAVGVHWPPGLPPFPVTEKSHA